MLSVNLNVVVVDADPYARSAITSYLAWDRRTRVIHRTANLDRLYEFLRNSAEPELPDVVLLDASLLQSSEETIRDGLQHIKQLCEARIYIMSVYPDENVALMMREHGASGYLVREDVGLQVSWMVVWAHELDFITSSMAAQYFPDVPVLPDGREFPELTDRVRQALMLCVVEGMSAELAADEMGLSKHTIRTYVKEGYSILEANDQTEYPSELSPQERAFMRLTALSLDTIEAKMERGKD